MDTEKDCNDLLEESIKKLLKKLDTLDPASDEYRKVNEQLNSQLRNKNEADKNQAEFKLKERHEENEEIMTEREYEARLKKEREDRIRYWTDTGVKIASGVAIPVVCFGFTMYCDSKGILPSDFGKDFIRNFGFSRKTKLN